MANIKSQIKRNRQNDKRRLRNRVYRGEARIAIKNARVNIEENLPESKIALRDAISALDIAARKGVIHRNNAARRKSRLVKAYSKIAPLKMEMPQEMVKPVSEAEVVASSPGSTRSAQGGKKASTRKATIKSPSKEKKLVESKVEAVDTTGSGTKVTTTGAASTRAKKPAARKTTSTSTTRKKLSSTRKTTSKKTDTTSSKAKKK